MDKQTAPFESHLVRELDEAAEKLMFMSEVSRVLSTALTDKECFNRLLELVVPKLADWATLSVVNDKGEIQRVAVGATRLEKKEILEKILNNYPPRLDDPIGSGYVISHGASEFEPVSSFENLTKSIGHPEWLPAIQAVGIKSRINVPLKVEGKVLGSLWIATSESNRSYTETDLRLTEEIACRAAYSLYNLMRYSSASQSISRLEIEMEMREQFLSNIRHDVLSVLTTAQLSAQLIQRTEECDKKNVYARRIAEAIGKATAILRCTKINLPSRHN